MKSLNLLLAGALTLGLWSCSSDEPAPNKGIDTKGDVFATLTLDLPQGRSETDTPDDNGDYPAHSTNGNEVGKDYENNVDAIYVVLAESTDEVNFTYITKSYSSSVMDQSKGKATFTIQFKSSELETFAGSIAEGATKPVYVFTYCNPVPELKAYLDGLNAASTDNFVNKTYQLLDGATLPFAQPRQFLMTNALLATSNIPAFDVLIKNNNTVATAFNLGTVKVERVASRFDFQEKPAEGNVPKNGYPVKDNASGLTVAYVQFDGMSLINEAKEFYYLPRVADALDNGGWSTDVELCGYELGDLKDSQGNVVTKSNYVISPYFTEKLAYAGGSAYSTISDKYFYNLGLTPNEYTYSWVTNTEDNDDWIGAAGTSYKIWRYATENTLPVNAQVRGITTGVIFRSEIKPYTPTETELAEVQGTHPAVTFGKALESGETIYAYTQTEEGKDLQVTTMLGTAKDVYAYAYTHLQSDIRTKFVKAVREGAFTVTINGTAVTEETALFPEIKTGTEFETMQALLDAVVVTMPDANSVNDGGQYVPASNYNFVAYKPDEDGHYYNYYYYYNKHNDNNDINEMGVMEFATVRNNIYKLKISKVAGFGQPGDVKPNPNTDDENPEVYFQVSALVLDWVVRVNDIEL